MLTCGRDGATPGYLATLLVILDMQLLLAVAAGSAIGGVSRFLLSGAVQSRVSSGLPFGTLLVNVLGSLVLGAVARHALVNPALSPSVRLFLTAGFCGGFTTFSTFSFETLELIQGGQVVRAVLYTLASVALGLAAATVGFSFVRPTP